MSNKFFFGILNGGKSERFGSPKSMFLYNGIPLIEYIYKILLTFSNNIVILGESEKPTSLKDVPTIKDAPIRGPISALVSAYNYKKTDWFFVATDMYKITKEMIEDMLSLQSSNNESIIAYHANIKKYEPFFAYYTKELLENIIQNINTENYSLQRILSLLNIEGNIRLGDKYRENFKSLNHPS